MSLRAWLAGVVVGIWLLAGGAAGASALSGRVELVTGAGRTDPSADPSLAVVYFEPVPPAAVRPAAAPLEMVTRGKAFEPQVLAVTRGSTVRFPNLDPILHNVFSVSAGNRFDLGLYSKGRGKPWTFGEAGVVRVFCNVHHSMVGYVLVLETPHFTSPDARGNFTLDGLAGEGGTLTVWHPRAEPQTTRLGTTRLTPGGQAPLAVRLPVTLERVPLHLNKFGRDYKRGRRDRYPP